MFSKWMDDCFSKQNKIKHYEYVKKNMSFSSDLKSKDLWYDTVEEYKLLLYTREKIRWIAWLKLLQYQKEEVTQLLNYLHDNRNFNS